MNIKVKGNEKLNILFLPAWYPSEKNPIVGVFIKEHARAVSLYDSVTVLYAERVKRNVRGLYEIVSDEKEDGIRTIRIKYRRLPVPGASYFIYLWSMFTGFRKLLKEGWRPDVIHAHIYSAAVPAVIIAKRYKLPVVLTEHCSGFPRHTLTGISVLQARWAMKKAAIILPVSKTLETAIKSYGIKNQFKVVPNVVNTEIFYPSSRQNSNEKKRILSVALLVPIKGIPYLLEALYQLKQKRQDFVLDIVGDGANRKEYEELAEELGLGEAVKFHGLKMKEEVADFMRECDFFVQPSLYETFGVTYIEAIACGKPVVATRLTALEEKINEGRGVLVPPKNVAALAEAIDYMLDHHQDYSPEKISQYVKDNFGYKLVGKKLNDIYRKVLSHA